MKHRGRGETHDWQRGREWGRYGCRDDRCRRVEENDRMVDHRTPKWKERNGCVGAKWVRETTATPQTPGSVSAAAAADVVLSSVLGF